MGLPRHALADSLVVALDEDGSGPIVGFAGRGGDEITHVERDRDDVADALVTWLLEVDEHAPITVWDGADALTRAVARAGLEVASLVADGGGTHVYINAQPQPGYVASTSAYFSAGFELVERATTYVTPGPGRSTPIWTSADERGGRIARWKWRRLSVR